MPLVFRCSFPSFILFFFVLLCLDRHCPLCFSLVTVSLYLPLLTVTMPLLCVMSGCVANPKVQRAVCCGCVFDFFFF